MPHGRDIFLRGNRDRDSGAAHEPQSTDFGTGLRACKIIGRARILDQPRFARRSLRAAEPLQADKAGTVLSQRQKAGGDAIAQRSAIAVKINDHRPALLSRHMPGNNICAQHHLRGLWVRRPPAGPIRAVSGKYISARCATYMIAEQAKIAGKRYDDRYIPSAVMTISTKPC